MPAETEKTESRTEERTTEPGIDDPKKKVDVVVIEDNPPARSTPAGRRAGRRRTPPRSTPPAETEPSTIPEETPATVPPARTRRGRAAARPKATIVKEPDPLEKVNLVILFKDGTTIARPMSEVLRFTVDKGQLTVIAKDGSIGRYSILDVARVTIE